MAAPVVAHHTRHNSSSPPKRTSKPVTKSATYPPPGVVDVYYGHEETAKMAAAFISSLFSCPETLPPPPAGSTSAVSPSLAQFIAYALHRTRLHQSVTFSALFLLSRLKQRFPNARGSSGHRLFISAFMIASKVICDDTYSNKSWCVVGQGMFSLKEINQMEREMCGYLEWVLNVEAAELEEFEAKVRRDFAPAKTTTLVQPIPPPARRETLPSSRTVPSRPAPAAARDAYPSPESSPPTPSHSTGTSPASSTCATPPSSDEGNTAIVSGSGNVVPPPVPSKKEHIRIQRPDTYAFAAPSVW